MERERTVEMGLPRLHGSGSGFTPITVSADFAALGYPKCRNDDATQQEGPLHGDVKNATGQMPHSM